MTRVSPSGFPGTGFFRPAWAALLAAVLLLLVPGTLSGAEKKERKVVRIPCQEFNRQMIVDANGKPVSGYAYDYIQTMATYAGWEVQYLPGSTFSECMQQVADGEADLFYEVSYTPERAQSMLFPDEPMGYEYYYLYTSENHTDIAPDDYAALDGKTVGVTKGTILGGFLEQWAEKKNISFKLVEYADIEEKEADLFAGKIDFDLEVSMLAKSNLSAVEKIGSSTYYLVANKDRPDLIEDLNAAMEKVINNDLYFFTRLQERYFSDTVLSHNLTTDEKAWIASHDVLRVGYFDDYLPFSGRDKNGNPIGVVIDAIQEIVQHLKLMDNLQLEFICYENQQDGYRAVESGEIDLMVPAYISSSVQHDYRVVGGRIFVTIACDFTFLDSRDIGKTPLRIGVNKHNLMQYYYSRDTHPLAEIVFYDGIRGCLDGILDDTSDGTFLNGLRSGALLKTDRFRALETMRAKNAFELHMAFAEDNLGLLLLMNRGMTMLETDFINKNAYAYAGWLYRQSVGDFLREHFLSALLLAAFLAGLVVVAVAFRISNRKLGKINRALVAYSETIEEQSLKEADLRRDLERKQGQLEDALHMAQSANRAKTAFLSSMSHDIRTPMNAIIGFTGLAASHLDDKEHVKEYLKTIAQSSEHLLSLINEVLDMSHIESGKMALNEKVESLADILHALRDIVHAGIQAKQHRFLVDAVDVRDELVHCDKLRLNQVLINLISNAIKYTPPGGTISLRLVQKAAASAGRARFEFRCKDNGIGMDEDFAKTVFDPFTREQTSTVSGIQGTGLGMAIAKNIVEMMGGTISVASKKGEGTEFTVAVDFRVAEWKTADPAIPELKDLRGLVVNGDVNACQNIADMLREVGMRCEWCLSGEEAVIRAEESVRHGDRFKVCVVDRFMPDMDGVETVRRIRQAVGEDDSILLLSAYEWGDVENEAREAGVTEFLTKPLFASDLNKVLLLACGRACPVRLPKKEPHYSLEGKKILMVDDSPLNLKIGVLLLREKGALVDTAPNGKAAVDLIREKGVGAYDFVVMDVQMPVMDGYQATAAIRKLPGGDKLKIIAFSANAFEEDKEKSLKAGMNGHISKPLKINEFLSELRRFSA
ncbi:MAG: response regulator [Kiritimatiellae bacterium]|nr:response regulator [Kiritimatiellia bacterium]